MYLLDVCSLRKVPVSVEERDRLQPKLTCSAQKRGGGGGSYCATWGEGLDVKSCFDAFH